MTVRETIAGTEAALRCVPQDSSELAQAYDEWRRALHDESLAPEQREELRLKIPTALIELRDVARKELMRLAGR